MANYSHSYKVGEMHHFNTHDGFLEAVVRGYRKGILSATDYGVLTQCDTLEDLKVGKRENKKKKKKEKFPRVYKTKKKKKVYLNNSTDYTETFLQNEPSPIHTTTIAEHATRKLVDEFE